MRHSGVETLQERIKFMSKDNAEWTTKYGRRRVRQETPTLDEAIAAAQGLADSIDEQTEIAASLMGLPHDQVRAELMKLPPPRRDTIKSVAFTGPASAPRTVVVERKISRRPASATGNATLSRPLSASAARRSW
jgi:hypothetical protein